MNRNWWRFSRAAVLLLALTFSGFAGTDLSLSSNASQSGKPPATGDAALVDELEAASGGSATITAQPLTGKAALVGFASGHAIEMSGASGASGVAQQFVDRYGSLFGAASGDLAADAPVTAAAGGSVVRYHQRYQGIAVYGGDLLIRLDAANHVESAVAKLMPGLTVDTTAAASATDARTTAAAAVADNYQLPPGATVDTSRATLAIYDPAWLDASAPRAPRLVWRVTADGTGYDREARQLVMVDADRGTVVDAIEKVPSALERHVCNDGNNVAASSDCTNPVRSEGDGPTNDAQVNAIYDQLGAVYSFYSTTLGRDSIDGAGLPLKGVARGCSPAQSCPMSNAFWNGVAMVFGDGFAVDDVTGHELTHGVTQTTSGLVYSGESGAINESMSDIFGEFIDLTDGIGNDAANLRWQLGEELPGGAIRDMADPPAHGDPDRVSSSLWYSGSDNGVFVHTNSGVGNKAAFLITDGGTFNGFTVNGIGIDKAAHVFYEAQQSQLPTTSNYRDLGNGLLQACSIETSRGVTTQDDCRQVKNAVDATEMLRTRTPNNGSAMQPRPECAKNLLARNDDGSTGQIAMPFPINFFGNVQNALYVNNNGNVTFSGPQSTYTPFGLTSNIGTPIIAPFFADIDTRGLGSDVVTYGASDDGKTFCAEWGGTGVGYYAFNTDKLVRARLVLEDQSGAPGGHPGDFDIVFEYDTAKWETGDASGGSGGFGGASARAGFSAGTGVANTFFEFSGSGANGALVDGGADSLIGHNRNSAQLGRYRFPIRDGDVPIGSSVSGTVYAGSAATGNEVASAFVQLCATSGGFGCGSSTSDAGGQYQIAGLPAGDYDLRAFPPANSTAPPTQMTLHVPDRSDITQDIVLDVPQPIPDGTTITNLHITSGIPSVYWGEPLTLTTHGCAGGTASYAVTRAAGSIASGPMIESPAGTYTGSIPPLRPVTGYARIEITINCPGGSQQVIRFDIYIDPSGTVVDGQGHPIANATVTLLRSEAASGPFEAVPDGSAVMSPANRTNPALTNVAGHFGWDVIAGYYQVSAEAPGCHAPGDPTTASVISSILTIPPPVTDLVLQLECTSTPVKHTLGVSVSGSGSVVSSPAALSCPGTCAADFDEGTSVALTAAPGTGFTFTGWSGDCSGTGPCNVTMDADHLVTATFMSTPPPRRLELDGDARVCDPRIDVELDDIEHSSSGRLRGEVNLDPRHGHDFESRKITVLDISGNLAVIKGTGKYHGHSGYSFVLIAVDYGRSSAHPDVLAFMVSDDHGHPVMTARFQGICKGDVKIREDHDAS